MGRRFASLAITVILLPYIWYGNRIDGMKYILRTILTCLLAPLFLFCSKMVFSDDRTLADQVAGIYCGRVMNSCNGMLDNFRIRVQRLSNNKVSISRNISSTCPGLKAQAGLKEEVIGGVTSIKLQVPEDWLVVYCPQCPRTNGAYVHSNDRLSYVLPYDTSITWRVDLEMFSGTKSESAFCLAEN